MAAIGAVDQDAEGGNARRQRAWGDVVIARGFLEVGLRRGGRQEMRVPLGFRALSREAWSLITRPCLRAYA